MSTAVEQQRCPLNLDAVTADLIMQFIVSLRSRNGDRLSSSSLNCYRSAITYVYRAFRREVPADFSHSLATDIRGLKRTNAMLAAAGEVTINQGKDPLPCKLCKE
jgi:hypothetical protein